jgi:hypothetical protein
MLEQRSWVLAGLLVLAAACSNGAEGELGGDAGDAARVVPEGLEVTALPGGNGVLELFALTLRQGPSQPELLAALRNAGDSPACSAALSVELFDQAGTSLAAGVGGLLTERFHRRTDGSGEIAACVGPGDVTLTAVMDLPPALAVEDVRAIVYRCPYFALDVVPVEGLAIRRMERVVGSAGTAYAGMLVNGFDVTVSQPSVTVFPVNRVGRPLGMATASGALELPPGGSWAFETSAVDSVGVDYVALTAGALAD